MMKIMLVNPSSAKIYGRIKNPAYPPLGLAYIASSLEKAGHAVKVCDMDAAGMAPGDLETLCRTENPAIVGITATTPTYKNALKIAEAVKASCDASTVLGGIHPTLMPGECISQNAVDFVVRGEGESAMVELAEIIGANGDFSGVRGIMYKKGDNVCGNEVRPPASDLDSIPFPSRKTGIRYEYSYPDTLEYPVFPIITSRGCPGKCTFCTASSVHGRLFRRRSAANVADEIEMLVKEYGAREIHIWDDNFITSRNRVFEIRDEILKRRIKALFAFPNGIRADFVSPDVLKALKEMGAYSVSYGVESGSQAMLDRMKKGISLERIEETFRLTREAGLEIWAFFLLGLPGETPSSIMDTIRFAVNLDPDIAKFHILKPYPGSEVYAELSSSGLISDFNYENYGIHTPPVHHLPSLSENDLLAWQKKAYKSFYLRPGKIIRHISRLRSFHRLKVNCSTAVSLLENIFSRKP